MSEKIARVAYRFDTAPATYDFVSWMALVERTRIEQGIDKVLIALVPGTRSWSDRDRVMSDARHTWRVNELIPALATLLPSCVGVVQGNPETDQQTVPYNAIPCAFGAYLAGPEYMRALVPFTGPYITLTVRQSWFQRVRDTKPRWNRLIPMLGLPVVVVPDTEAEMDGQPCVINVVPSYPAAAFNPALRFALYKKARLNLFTSGGPAALAMYSDLNAEVFGLCVPQYLTCAEKNLTDSGLTDGRLIQNTRLHWAADEDTILKAVKERLEC